MAKLRNSLIDSCVVMGVNTETEIQNIQLNDDFTFDDSRSRNGPIKQDVIAVLTETVAYFPESRRKMQGEPFYSDEQVITPLACISTENGTGESSGYRRSISYNVEAKRVLPFSTEVIDSLPTFCFPAGGYIYSSHQKTDIFYQVLTNMEGLRTYVVCVNFTVPHYFQSSNGQVFLSKVSTHNRNSPIVYVPQCICLVSMHPYINTLRKCLSSLVSEIETEDQEFWRLVMKISTTLASVPVPPPGPLTTRFQLFGFEHELIPADEAGRRVVDLDLHLPLLILSPDDIVLIVTCFITQQRMLFTSSDYSLLTVITESFLTYIDPIRWRLPYVPVLPDSLVDLLEAPGQFIMGVHTSLKQQVRQLRKQPETPGIVLIDLDRKQINLDNCKVPKMPDVVAQSLIVRLRNINPHFDIAVLNELTPLSYDDLTARRQKFYDNLHREIKDAFLDMMLSLFGDIFNFMNKGENFFDKEKYLKVRHDDEKDFFTDVIGTDSFDRFVEERLENHGVRDIFTMLAERISTTRKTSSRSRSSYIIQHLKRSSNILPSVFLRNRSVYDVPMMLEENLSNGNYFRIFRESLSRKLADTDNVSILLKASYLYLRGFAHLACSQPIEALRDFYALYSTAPDIFPRDIAGDIVNKLEPIDLDAIKDEAFYKQTNLLRTYTNKDVLRKRSSIRKLPDTELTRMEFEKRSKVLKIALSSNLSDILFDILSDKNDVVLPEQFGTFYKVFVDVEHHSELREVSGVTLKSEDRILKVSPLITTLYGMGRIILTTNFLLFIGDGARQFSKVTHLSDIDQVVKYTHSSVFWTGVQSLRIINSDPKIPPFYASLRSECDIWLLLLNEMSSGHKSSIAMKDPKMIDLCENDVLVANSLLEIGYSLREIELVCLYHKTKASYIEGLSEETKEALEIRLDPCVRESKPTTVMCLAYVPGNSAFHESPTLWCGMGSGAIMIYDTDKWNCVSELRLARNRISCMQLVSHDQLWVGSYDSVIYVINTEKRKSEQQLQNHTDFVSSIIKTENEDGETVVWSSSYNGQVISWDPLTRESRNSFLIDKRLLQIIMLKKSLLWCVTPYRILIVDLKQNDCPIVQKLILYDNSKMPISLEYSLKVLEDEIWLSTKKNHCIYVYKTNDSFSHERFQFSEKVNITSMVACKSSVWAGNSDGGVFQINQETKKIESNLHAHLDLVKSMCVTEKDLLITGSASREGKVCVWNTTMGFEVIDGKRRRVIRKAYDEIMNNYEFVQCENAEEVFEENDLPSPSNDHF